MMIKLWNAARNVPASVAASAVSTAALAVGALLGLAILTATSVRAEPPANAWTGLWVGPHVGVAATSTEVDGGVRLAGDGLLAGAGAGLDFKVNNIVAGVWGEYTFANLETSFAGERLKLEGTWAAGVRLGWLVNQRLLAYGLYGWTETEASASFGSVPRFSGSVYGGGIEALLAGDAFSVKLEYRRTLFGTEDAGGGSLQPDHHALRLGVAWRLSFWR